MIVSSPRKQRRRFDVVELRECTGRNRGGPSRDTHSVSRDRFWHLFPAEFNKTCAKS